MEILYKRYWEGAIDEPALLWAVYKEGGKLFVGELYDSQDGWRCNCAVASLEEGQAFIDGWFEANCSTIQ